MHGKIPPSLAVVLWLGVIFLTSCYVVPLNTWLYFIQSVLPGATLRNGFPGFWLVCDVLIVKGWHATEHFIIVILADRALSAIRRAWATPTVRRGMAFALAVAWGASDEWHQTFVPGRGGNFRDVLIDASGATVAVFWLFWQDKRRKQTATERNRASDAVTI